MSPILKPWQEKRKKQNGSGEKESPGGGKICAIGLKEWRGIAELARREEKTDRKSQGPKMKECERGKGEKKNNSAEGKIGLPIQEQGLQSCWRGRGPYFSWELGKRSKCWLRTSKKKRNGWRKEIMYA